MLTLVNQNLSLIEKRELVEFNLLEEEKEDDQDVESKECVDDYQTRHEDTVADNETTTTIHEHTIECGDRTALCRGSNFIKNLVNTMATDEPLPAFSDKHIVDGETLKRVVELLTVQSTIPEKELIILEDPERPRQRPFSVGTLHVKFREQFKTYHKQDGHRCEMLKVLVVAHYLDCPEIVYACSVYLANAFKVCMELGSQNVTLFRPSSPKQPRDEQLTTISAAERFGNGVDPLVNVPTPVLVEIAEQLFDGDILAAAKESMGLSSALCGSLAFVDRLWAGGWNWDSVDKLCSEAQFSNPSCNFALLLEKRLTHRPTERLPLMKAIGAKKNFHKRWTSLVKKFTTQFVNDDSNWVNGAPLELVEKMDLSSAAVASLPVCLRRLWLRDVPHNSNPVASKDVVSAAVSRFKELEDLVVEGDTLQLKELAKVLKKPNKIARRSSGARLRVWIEHNCIRAAKTYCAATIMSFFNSLSSGVELFLALDEPGRFSHCVLSGNTVVIEEGNVVVDGPRFFA